MRESEKTIRNIRSRPRKKRWSEKVVVAENTIADVLMMVYLLIKRCFHMQVSVILQSLSPTSTSSTHIFDLMNIACSRIIYFNFLLKHTMASWPFFVHQIPGKYRGQAFAISAFPMITIVIIQACKDLTSSDNIWPCDGPTSHRGRGIAKLHVLYIFIYCINTCGSIDTTHAIGIWDFCAYIIICFRFGRNWCAWRIFQHLSTSQNNIYKYHSSCRA